MPNTSSQLERAHLSTFTATAQMDEIHCPPLCVPFTWLVKDWCRTPSALDTAVPAWRSRIFVGGHQPSRGAGLPTRMQLPVLAVGAHLALHWNRAVSTNPPLFEPLNHFQNQLPHLQS